MFFNMKGISYGFQANKEELKYLENAKPPKGPNLLSSHPNTNKRSSELEVSSQFVISSIQMLTYVLFLLFWLLLFSTTSGWALDREDLCLDFVFLKKVMY